MKKYLSSLLILVALTLTSKTYTWTYSLSNRTSKTIAVGIVYQQEPQSFEIRIITPKTMDRFKPGDPGISDWKKLFVVDHFLYIVNPPTISDVNKSELPWKTVTLAWIPSEFYNKAMDLSDTQNKQGLAALLTENGTSTGLTMAASRHIDIIEDENGDIHFITLLQP